MKRSFPIQDLRPISADDLEETQKGILPTEGIPFPTSQALRPDPSSELRAPAPTQRILQPLYQGQSLDTRDRRDKRRQYDSQLTSQDWQKVYEAYAMTDKPKALARITNLSGYLVKYLLQYGIKRLNLPPIQEHAIDLAKVNLAIKENDEEREENFKRNLPQIQESVTSRTAKEAAASQALLTGAMKSADIFLNYTNTLLDRLTNGQSEYEIPEQVTLRHIELLAKAASTLSSAVNTASQVSRRTAGEPERNLSLEISVLVNQLSDDELHNYLKTNQLPQSLRLLQGGSLTPIITDSKIIDIEEEKIISDGNGEE